MQTFIPPPVRMRLGFAIVLLGTTALFAQTAPETENQEVITLDRFVVTGSHLPSAQGASPVAVIGAQEIERSGVSSNVLDVLRKQMPAFSGSGNVGANNASTGATSTYGGSRLSLHNMATLVLLNGRRVATSGANARGGSSFVDVNQFPLSAIERIEVVTDGASAVYGSDAVGGVVNIILKPNFNGSEIGGQYAFSTRKGDYSEKSAYFSAGASKRGLSVVVNGSYFKSTPLMQTDRVFSQEAKSTSYSGVVGTSYLNPLYDSPSDVVPVGTAATAATLAALPAGTYLSGVPGLNLAGDVTLLTAQEKRTGYASLNYKLIDKKLEAFGDVLYSKNKSYSQLGAQFTLFNGTGANPQQVAVNTPYNPTRASLSPAFRYLPAPRRYSNDATLIRFTAGLKGEISSNWSWEAAYNFNRNKLKTQISNVLYTPNLDLAVAGGYDQNGNVVTGGRYSRVYTDYLAPAVPAANSLTTAAAAAWLASQRNASNTVLQPALDPFATSAGTDPASLANVLGTSHADFTGGLQSLDLVVRGKVFSLPAGSIAVAVGGDHRSESLKGEPDVNSRSTGSIAQRWSGGTFFDDFDQTRTVNAGFVEVNLPVASAQWNIDAIHALDLTFAYRAEHYNDMGNSSSPKFGVRWQPVDDQVTVRYTYSKGFAAPTLFQMFGTQQALSSDLRTLLSLTSGVWQATVRQTPNENLKPVTATTNSVGVTITPKALKGLKLSVDYSDADLVNLVGRVGSSTILQSVDQLGTASPYANQVMRYNPGDNTPLPITAAGQVRSHLLANSAPATASVLTVIDPALNLVAAKVRSIDLSAEYSWTGEDKSNYRLGTAATYFLDDKIQSLPGDSYYEYAGLMTSYEGTMPGYRYYTTLDWSRSNWEATFANTYIPPVDDINTGGAAFATSTTARRIRLASVFMWDVSLAYNLSLGDKRSLQLKAGINNLTDEMPPVSSQAFSAPNSPGADTGTYGLLGRIFYVSAAVKF